MNGLFYEMIFKRKSFHIFRDTGKGKISKEELIGIEKKFKSVKPLFDDIKVDMKIVKEDETSCKRGADYCILLYSEKKGNYLQNIGYIGEQLDLYLASMDIGSLWFGIGKVKEDKYNGLDFVIMIAISKVKKDKFRKDMYKSKRKPLEEIYEGKNLANILNVVRFSPSACNTQPWMVEEKDNMIKVFRYKKEGKRGMMPVNKVTYYNRIDMGIFLFILEVCLKNEGIIFQRELYDDYDIATDLEKVLVAIYKMQA